MGLDFIVKLGGSAITDKGTLETAKLDAIERAASVLVDCYKLGYRFVILHGVGSFGHHLSSKHRLRHGYRDRSPEEQQNIKLVLSEVRLSLLRLNKILTEQLVHLGIPALTISTFNSWLMDDGALKSVCSNCDVVSKSLEEGFVPVLHGDWVFDSNQGCAILSSDAIMQFLCKTLEPKRVIFLMDCDGLYSLPPDTPGAQLLPRVLVRKDSSLSVPVEMNCTVPDASGGIHAKLTSAVAIILQQDGTVPVFLCSLASEAFRNICLNGDSGGCNATVLSLEPTLRT